MNRDRFTLSTDEDEAVCFSLYRTSDFLRRTVLAVAEQTMPLATNNLVEKALVSFRIKCEKNAVYISC